MATLYDAPTGELLDAVADDLGDRDAVEAPDWVQYAKTGTDREMPPQQADFWARRAASLLRKVAVDGPTGVERLATAYGGTSDGTTRYRVAPPRQRDGSKKVVRVALQQLEEEDLVETAQGEGRRITAAGQSLLDETAGEVIENLDRDDLERYA